MPEKSIRRSFSECQLRDHHFYEMCDDEDEIAIYFKAAEQSILEQMNLIKNPNTISVNKTVIQQDSSQDNNFTRVRNGSGSNINERVKSNSSSIINNQLVFLNMHTLNKLYEKYIGVGDRTQIGHQIGGNMPDTHS